MLHPEEIEKEEEPFSAGAGPHDEFELREEPEEQEISAFAPESQGQKVVSLRRGRTVEGQRTAMNSDRMLVKETAPQRATRTGRNSGKKERDSECE